MKLNRSNLNLLKDNIDSLFKNNDCKHINTLINTAFSNIEESIDEDGMPNEFLLPTYETLKYFSLFVPFLENKENINICFLNDGKILVYKINKEREVLKIYFSNENDIEFNIGKKKSDLAVYLGTLDVGDNNYQEIESLFILFDC